MLTQDQATYSRLRAGLLQNPNDPEAWLMLGSLLLEHGQISEQQHHRLETLVRSFPVSHESHIGNSRMWYRVRLRSSGWQVLRMAMQCCCEMRTGVTLESAVLFIVHDQTGIDLEQQ